MNNTAAPMFISTRSFPLSAIRKIDSFVDSFCSLHVALEEVVYRMYSPELPSYNSNLRKRTLLFRATGMYRKHAGPLESRLFYLGGYVLTTANYR